MLKVLYLFNIIFPWLNFQRLVTQPPNQPTNKPTNSSITLSNSIWLVHHHLLSTLKLSTTNTLQREVMQTYVKMYVLYRLLPLTWFLSTEVIRKSVRELILAFYQSIGYIFMSFSSANIKLNIQFLTKENWHI